MPPENLAALKRLYAQWAEGDWSDASLFDPFVVGVMPDPAPRPQYGREALAAYWRRFLERWEGFRVQATSYQEIENTILVTVRRFGSGTASGLELEDRAAHLWTFRGPKVVRMEVFAQEAEALAALGLTQ